jgi:hypothetical protein
MYTVRKYHIVLKDEIEMNLFDFSPVFEEVLGTSLPKFNGDVRFWPSFLAIYRLNFFLRMSNLVYIESGTIFFVKKLEIFALVF